jgi:hypothetical protein
MLTIPPPPAPARTSFDDDYETRRNAAAGHLAFVTGTSATTSGTASRRTARSSSTRRPPAPARPTASTPSKPSPPSSASTSPHRGDREHLPRHLSLEQEQGGTDRGPANTGTRPPLTYDERRDLDAARQLAAAINHAPTGTGPR